jgi:hypothetical protein
MHGHSSRLVSLAAAGVIAYLLGCNPGTPTDNGNDNSAACVAQGLVCSESDTCCSGLLCSSAGICDAVADCSADGAECTADQVCCAGLICSNAICKVENLPDPDGPSADALSDFALADINPESPRYQQNISPRQYLGKISAWYFGHST